MTEEEFRTGKRPGMVVFTDPQIGFRCGFCMEMRAHVHQFEVSAAEPESYAHHPTSIAEIRSVKTGHAKDWTVRDMLVAMLREIDEGKLKPLQGVIVIRIADGADGKETAVRISQAQTTSFIETLGILQRGIQLSDPDRP